MNDSQTPRTDNQEIAGYAERVVYADFARQLEKELSNTLQKDSLKTREINLLTQENRKLLKQIESLLEYARHGPNCPMPSRACDCGLKDLLVRD